MFFNLECSLCLLYNFITLNNPSYFVFLGLPVCVRVCAYAACVLAKIEFIGITQCTCAPSVYIFMYTMGSSPDLLHTYSTNLLVSYPIWVFIFIMVCVCATVYISDDVI